jgi:hypothetical protein
VIGKPELRRAAAVLVRFYLQAGEKFSAVLRSQRIDVTRANSAVAKIRLPQEPAGDLPQLSQGFQSIRNDSAGSAAFLQRTMKRQ